MNDNSSISKASAVLTSEQLKAVRLELIKLRELINDGDKRAAQRAEVLLKAMQEAERRQAVMVKAMHTVNKNVSRAYRPSSKSNNIHHALNTLNNKLDKLLKVAGVIHENTIPAVGWLTSIVAAFAIVYPGIDWVHDNENKYRILQPVSHGLKELETATANIALSLGINAVGGDTGYYSPLKRELHVTSGYGWRKHPVTGIRKFHTGTDYRCSKPESILAMQDGDVIFSGSKGGYGDTVIIKHTNGEFSQYSHLSALSVDVGDNVAVSEKLGECGSTGTSTGDHLHIELFKSGSDPLSSAPEDKMRVDPALYVGIKTDSNQWDYFKQVVAASESAGAGHYTAVNRYTRYVGAYQMGTQSLCDVGYVKQAYCQSPNSALWSQAVWNIPGGLGSFLGCDISKGIDHCKNEKSDAKAMKLQDAAYIRWMRVNMTVALNGLQIPGGEFIPPALDRNSPAWKVSGFMHASQFGVKNAMNYYSLGKDSKIGRNVATSVYGKRGEDAFKKKYGAFANGAELIDTVMKGVE